MASFDPSIISQIPDSSGNPLESRAKAFKLADLMTEQQRNKMLLSSAQEQEQERKKASDIFKGFKGNIGTAEGNTQLAGLYQKAGLQKPAMEALQLGSEQHIQELTTKKMQLEFQADQVGTGAASLLNTLHTKGIAAVQAEYQAQLPALNEKMKQMGLPPLPPQFPAQDPAKAEQILQAQIAHSQTARQMLSQQNKAKDEARADERLSLAERTASRQDAREARAEKQQRDKEAGVLSPEDLKFTAQQYLAGDKSVFQNIGRGAQGAKNVVALRKAIRQEAEAEGKSPQDVATKLAEFTGLVSEERSLGTRQAAIETAATEAQQVIPIALKASEAVPRGQFVPLNKLIQAGKVATSDPNLARFAQANLTLANVYARAISPTGVPTVSGREHALEVLGTATSQEAYRGVVDIMKQEIEAARKSPSMVRQGVRASVKGDYNAPAPGPAAGTKGNQNDPLGIR